MDSRRKQLWGNLLGFAVLFAVSLYRQLSLRYLPGDGLRTYVLYGCYVLLLTAWGRSVWTRVTQRSMRTFLIWEGVFMFLGLTIRFVQDTYLKENIALLRSTGLLLAATLLPIMILGLYASLCVGRENGWRIPRRWYLLLIPAAVFVPLVMTDGRHHFFTYLVPEEPQPNLTYHPALGFYLVFGLVLGLAVARVFQIFRRNALMKDRPVLRRCIPFLEGGLLLVFYLPYLINWLRVNAPLAPFEIIEQYAKIYYIEILTWEIYIRLGLVPVNTEYREIFEQSTLGLQLLCDGGERIRSRNAGDLPQELLDRLRQEGVAELGSRELRIRRLRGAEVLWTKDVSQLRETIEGLNRSAEDLAQEGVLLSEELKTKREEARLAAKNEIYDTVTREVQMQLQLIREICKKQAAGGGAEQGLRQLAFLGTYVKRRCNLRLIQREQGRIGKTDLYLSVRELLSAAELLGLRTSLRWEGDAAFSPRFSVAALDLLESLMEQVHFSAETLEVSARPGSLDIALRGSGVTGVGDGIPFDAGELSWTSLEGGVLATMREGVTECSENIEPGARSPS